LIEQMNKFHIQDKNVEILIIDVFETRKGASQSIFSNIWMKAKKNASSLLKTKSKITTHS